MKKLLIIGAGTAGLSAGIFARMNGMHAVICESHSIAGGCLSYWKRRGFHIDNCIHWLTGTNPNTPEYKMWRELGVLGENGEGLLRRDRLFTYCDGENSLSLSRDLGAFQQHLEEISPADHHEIRSYIRLIETVAELFGTGGEKHDKGFSVHTAAGLPLLVRYNRLSSAQLAQRFKSPLIRGFLTSFLPDNFGALSLAYVIASFTSGNGDLPYGGSEQMARRMTERFLSLGGELLLNKRAVKVLMSEDFARADSVLFADGTKLSADCFILTPDPSVIFGRILDAPMPDPLRKLYKHIRQPRFSAYQCAFAVEGDCPFDGDLTLPIPEEYAHELKAVYILVRSDTHEEGYAPAGKSMIQTMIYCDEQQALEWIKMRHMDRKGYTSKKLRCAAMVGDILTRFMPDLYGRMTVLDTWTPATYRRYTGSEIGSFMSFAYTEGRIPKRISCEIPGIKNVLLAGQWLQMPGGLPIAAMTGKLAAEKAMTII
jgi:phytoene dehydrogenase-like protein